MIDNLALNWHHDYLSRYTFLVLFQVMVGL